MTAQNTQTTAPLYVQFAQAIRDAIQAQGLPAPESAQTETGFPQNEGYFFVRWSDAALIVPKSKLRMSNLHSHVDLSGQSGYIALPKKNGRVVCHFTPDITKVSEVLHLFVNASKRPLAAPVRRLITTSELASEQAKLADLRRASQATPSMRVGTLADVELPAGDLEAASWSYSDDEAEEALQALNA